MTDLYRLLPAEVDDLIAGLGQPRYRAGQLLKALYREGPDSLDDLRLLPGALRGMLQDGGYEVGAAAEVRRVVSEDGNTTKLLLRMAEGTLIESVLMQYPEVVLQY